MTPKLVEGLAKAMYISAGFSDWDTPLPGMLECNWQAVRNAWMSHARAALSHLNIPAGSGPVNVGEAVAVLRRECARCEVKSLCCTCTGAEALHALGVEVD